ncbi:MAG: type II secretion system F family protein [Janthinobacterium lividum]
MNASHTDTLLNLFMLLALFAGLVGWWIIKQGSMRGKIAMRIRDAALNSPMDTTLLEERSAPVDFRGRLLARLAALGNNLPLFDGAYRMKLQKQMVRGGYRGKSAVSILLAIKFCVGAVCAVLAVTMGSHIPMIGATALGRGVAMMGAFIVGMIVPEYIMGWRAKRRRNMMAGCLPDALDLLVICTNAGNSFPVSMQRVADELASICPPLSNEFALTADELYLSGDTTRALQALGDRIDLPSIRALIATLMQSMRYGTPITHALRTLSRTERLSHIVSLEEKAAKLAPKMVVPMMLFILPPVVVIAAGPAVIQLLDFMNKK